MIAAIFSSIEVLQCGLITLVRGTYLITNRISSTGSTKNGKLHACTQLIGGVFYLRANMKCI